jgi:hypothetical protein
MDHPKRVLRMELHLNEAPVLSSEPPFTAGRYPTLLKGFLKRHHQSLYFVPSGPVPDLVLTSNRFSPFQGI